MYSKPERFEESRLIILNQQGLSLLEIVMAMAVVFLALLGFAGALILLRPGFAEISPWALLALGSTSVYAITMLAIKSLSRTEPPSRMVMYSSD